MNINNICVLGLGYIGLPTAALLANRGYMVYGVDVLSEVVEIINKGDIHIVEPELDTFVKSAVNAGKLVAGLKPKESDVFIIAVPTPFKENYVPNIEYVLEATRSIASYLRPGNMVILESTSPVGTLHKMQDLLESLGINTNNIYISHCPERVLPGKVMKELIENDRIVGGINEISTIKVKEFYETFVSGEVLTTDAKTAEMCKLVENSFRDVNIAFANELSMICDTAGINVRELISLANKHPRVNILQPGAGVGGHCIAVDPWFIVSEFSKEAKIIKQARLVNDYKSDWVFEKIKLAEREFEIANQKKPLIACLGLAFKPDIDDLRESAALKIVKRLQESKSNILAVEPNISTHKYIPLMDLSLALEKADIIVGLVAHKEFKNIKHVNMLNFSS